MKKKENKIKHLSQVTSEVCKFALGKKQVRFNPPNKCFDNKLK